MGVGDFRQDRLRPLDNAMEWVQHQFRYFTGQFLNSIRGHRVVWAVFNTALREIAWRQGCAVHRQEDNLILTKAELKELVETREGLVQKIARFGSDIPCIGVKSLIICSGSSGKCLGKHLGHLLDGKKNLQQHLTYRERNIPG